MPADGKSSRNPFAILAPLRKILKKALKELEKWNLKNVQNDRVKWKQKNQRGSGSGFLWDTGVSSAFPYFAKGCLDTCSTKDSDLCVCWIWGSSLAPCLVIT